MKRPPTMKDVARAAAVHQTTVSLALRNHPSIPEATRERIRRLARELGYRPNPLVSALMAERKKRQPERFGGTLAFLTATDFEGGWRKSYNYTRVFEATIARGLELGYRVEEAWLTEPGMTPQRMRDILLNRGTRGIIVCPLPAAQGCLDFNFTDFAAVALGRSLTAPLLDRIAIDFHAVVNLAIAKLREGAHERIAFAASRHIDRRLEHLPLGTFLAARFHSPQDIVEPFVTAEWDQAALAAWYRRERPDAIIAVTPREYLQCEEWLRAEGVSLPEEVSLICLDCSQRIKAGGVMQDLRGEAETAVDLVTSRVERAQFGVPQRPQIVQVTGQWCPGPLARVRRSLAPLL